MDIAQERWMCLNRLPPACKRQHKFIRILQAVDPLQVGGGCPLQESWLFFHMKMHNKITEGRKSGITKDDDCNG
jgi:hypothetical protein